MGVAYLTNLYPSPSHTFIRREMRALEAAGERIERFSIRPPSGLVDDDDRFERTRTRVLLQPSVELGRHLLQGSTTPLTSWRCALQLAWKMGRRSPAGLGRHGAYLLEAAALSSFCRTLDCSHVHAHFGSNPAAVAALCHALGGPPFSFTVHGPEDLEEAAAASLVQKMGRARFVVAISDYCRRRLVQLAPHAADKIHVIRCGLDGRLLEFPFQPVPEAPHLVAVGRLVERKRHIDLIEAVAQLAREGTKAFVTLIGDGPLRASLERSREELGVADRVRFLGTASGDDVFAEILAARALVLPSAAEGLPTVLVEAFALGRPVVATSIAAVDELVEEGKSGWLVRPQDPADLCRALREVLLASPAQLNEMGTLGRARARELHDARNSAARLRELFSRA